jgi:hypothetical protein
MGVFESGFVPGEFGTQNSILRVLNLKVARISLVVIINAETSLLDMQRSLVLPF